MIDTTMESMRARIAAGYRVMTDGEYYRVQERVLGLLWINITLESADRESAERLRIGFIDQDVTKWRRKHYGWRPV